MSEDKVKGIITAEIVCIDVADIIYNKGKAKLFTILESQLEGQKLSATKRIAEDVISELCRDAAIYLKDILGNDWQMEVETGGILEEQKAIEAQHAFQKVKEVIGIK